jgi:hypothetical protein
VARQAVEHDDVNVRCLGAWIIGPQIARNVIETFLASEFSTEEHFRRRVAKVADIELESARALASDLAGKSVAVNRSTTQDTDLTQNTKGATVVRYDDAAAVITAVVTGQGDLVGTSSALFQTMVQKAPNRQLEPKFVLRVNDLDSGAGGGRLCWHDDGDQPGRHAVGP